MNSEFILTQILVVMLGVIYGTNGFQVNIPMLQNVCFCKQSCNGTLSFNALQSAKICYLGKFCFDCLSIGYSISHIPKYPLNRGKE